MASLGDLQKFFLRLNPLSSSAFIFALGCILVGAAARETFGFFGATLQFATFFPVILIVGLFAGAYAASFAVPVISVFVWWALIPPRYRFGPLSATELVNFFLFWISAGLIICVTHYYRGALIALKEADETRTLLLNELNHRFGNTFAIIQAIINGTVNDAETAKNLSHRIIALSRANSLVSSTAVEAITLAALLQNEIGAYSSLDRLRLEGPDIELRGETARNISLIVHELTTNAAKYGSLSNAEGVLEIRWSEQGGYCNLHWKERDGPPMAMLGKKGFGTTLIRASLVPIEGTIDPQYHHDGFSCELKFRVAVLRS